MHRDKHDGKVLHFQRQKEAIYKQKSLAKLDLSELSINDCDLCDLEYVMNFELFQE